MKKIRGFSKSRYDKINDDFIDVTSGETFRLVSAGMADEKLGYVDVGDTILKNSNTGEILAGWPRSRFEVTDEDVILVLNSRDLSKFEATNIVSFPVLANLTLDLDKIYDRAKYILLNVNLIDSANIDLIQSGYKNAKQIFFSNDLKFTFSPSLKREYYALVDSINLAVQKYDSNLPLDITVGDVWNSILNMLIIIDSILTNEFEVNSKISSYGMTKQHSDNQIARFANLIYNSKLKSVKSIYYTNLENLVFDELTQGFNSRGNVATDAVAVIDFIIKKANARLDGGWVIFE